MLEIRNFKEKPLVIGDWNFEIIWNLEFGIWNLID